MTKPKSPVRLSPEAAKTLPAAPLKGVDDAEGVAVVNRPSDAAEVAGTAAPIELLAEVGPATGEVVTGSAAALIETDELRRVSLTCGELSRTVIPSGTRDDSRGENRLRQCARAICNSQRGSL